VVKCWLQISGVSILLFFSFQLLEPAISIKQVNLAFSSETNRADALGKLGVSYGVGMVLGPIIGGALTQYSSPQMAAFVAACFTGICILMVFFLVPTRTKKLVGDNQPEKDNKSDSNVGSLGVLLKLLSYPEIPFLLLVRIVTGLPLGVFNSMFSVVSIERFNVNPREGGYVLSYVGMLSLVMQGFGVGFMTRKYSDATLLKIGALTLVPYYIGLAMMFEFHHIYYLVPFVVFAMAIMNVVVTSSLTKAVSPKDTGAILGINMATNSLVRTLAPTIGGLLFQNFGFASFGYFGLVTTSGVIGLLMLKQNNVIR
jgi:OCT family organic cation transporter-like MFS transporter 18